MNTKKFSLILLLAVLPSFLLVAQTTEKAEQKEKTEKTKKGFSFGAVPAIAYDSDLGFRYGALANFYDYGDGTIYPFYKHSLYVEWSHTTKGSDTKQVKYDSEFLIPGIRVTADARLETEQAMDFYGFNGFNTLFNSDYATKGNPDRMFYKMDRQTLRLRANFQGKIIGRKLRWFAGLSHYNVGLDTVNISKLNKGKADEKLLNDITGLYEQFVSQGYIPSSQANGGAVTNFSVGIVADTRDNEPNPNKGIWSEAMLISSPGFLWNDNPFYKLVLSHRQYFSIIPSRLTFAYRLNYQTSLGSKPMPWYMLNYTFSTFDDREGLGGSKTLRGILRNRVVGEGFALGNFELRWKFAKFEFLKQNWYLALSPFVDMAKITKPYELPASFDSSPFYGTSDGVHISYGAGLHIALNQNFIVAVDYGMAASNGKKDVLKNDGQKGLYIGLDFLF